MDTKDLLEDVETEIPLSNAYKLLCDDAAGKIDKKSLEKQRLTAQKIKNVLEASKLKFKISVCQRIGYKNLDFGTKFVIKHPLHHLQKAIDATTSIVSELQWLKPKNVTVLEVSGRRELRVFV